MFFGVVSFGVVFIKRKLTELKGKLKETLTRKPDSGKPTDSQDVSQGPQAELHDAPGGSSTVDDPGGNLPVEAPGTRSPVEAPGTRSPVELPGTKSPVEAPGSSSIPQEAPKLPESGTQSTFDPSLEAPRLPESGTQSTFNPSLPDSESKSILPDWMSNIDLSEWL